MRVNWHIWSGIYRCAITGGAWSPEFCANLCPTVVVGVSLNDWALPLSVHVGGPLLAKPGLTFRIGPVNIGWSRL